MIKQCVVCDQSYSKPYYCSKKDWEARKFCSKDCKNKSQKGKPFYSPFGNTWGRGKQISEESKKKMSESHTGKIQGPHSLAHRLKISQAQKGERGYWFGKKIPEDIRRKMSEGNSNGHGPDNTNWKGGTTDTSRVIRNLSIYKRWRKEILEEGNHVCISCNKRKKRMQVHHKKQFAAIIKENDIKTTEEAIACEELWKKENGEIMCISCHNNYHKINGK